MHNFSMSEKYQGKNKRRGTHRLMYIVNPESENRQKWLELGEGRLNPVSGHLSFTMDRMPYQGFPEGQECEFILLADKDKTPPRGDDV